MGFVTYGLNYMYVLRGNPDGREPMVRKTALSNGDTSVETNGALRGKDGTRVCCTSAVDACGHPWPTTKTLGVGIDGNVC